MSAARTSGDGKKRRRLPGDPDERAATARMIRVDHAGEYGARRIYEGQRAVLGPAHPPLAFEGIVAVVVAV